MIELFSGIGAQIKGIQDTELFDCEVINTSDIDKDAMLSYAAIHNGITNELIKNYSDYPTREEMAKYLSNKNIGYNFEKNEPYNWFKLVKRKNKVLEKYYLSCILSKNLGDISKIKQLSYADLWTYSFPCQDISVSGKQAGIKQGTRSGLLFEVERLLEFADKNKTLPKYLLLENVKNLVGKRHIHNFNEWLKKLNELGYNTYYQVINGKNCGIPQNRERVFALSIRKDIDACDFQFPKAFDNGVRLKDVLENEVDDKYYLKTIKNYFMKHSIDCEQQGQGFRFKPHNPSKAETAFTISTKAGGRIGDNFINEKDLNDKPFFEFNTNNLKQVAQIYGTETEPNPQAGRIYDEDYISPTLDSCSGGNRMPKIIESDHSDWKQEMYKKFIDDSNGVVSGGYTNQSKSPMEGLSRTLKANANDVGVVENRKIRKLTEKECWRLMGFNDCCIEKAKQMQVASTQLYKQAGNSIITNCIKLLMEHLYKAQYDNTYVCEDENNIF